LTQNHRQMPVGAEVLPGGGVEFRVWAPRRKNVSVVLEGGVDLNVGDESILLPLTSEGTGYFSGIIKEATEGSLYRFQLDDDERIYPDPASRFQPEGPAGPSQVIDPSRFQWNDQNWRGVTLKGQVIYEMHIGTFTPEGTWEAASHYLGELSDIGITLIEVMPVSEFPGQFGWGYDGVDHFAPTRLYGVPDDFRAFVDQAHAKNIGVVLDVVYNHFGPVDNYLRMFSLDYFTDRYETDWGEALNLDGKNSGPVREFIIANALYWIREFHLDGLRLDATQSIIDRSPEHIVQALTRKIRADAKNRSIIVIAENEPQDVRLIRSADDGGFALDAIWNDDFHHAGRVALTGHNDGYYSEYLGTPQELISAAKWSFLYQGQYYTWQKNLRGTPTFSLDPCKFINYLQNHDQVANSARGDRVHKLTSSGRYRAMMTYMLLIPQTPMLFQGQEFCASAPFRYFADHEEDLANTVRQGRADFLKQFGSLTTQDMQDQLPDPADPANFESCKLDQSERQTHAEAYALHRDLLALRREDPVFRAQRTDWMHGAVVGPEAFILRFLGGEEGDRLLVVNLGRDLNLYPVSEPLLASPEESHWEILWASEAALYGGEGIPPLNTEGNWYIRGQAAVVLAPKKFVRARYA
jgi:maltooligosyltrehalose trehalohydrolase